MKMLIATVIWGTLLAGPVLAQDHRDVVLQVAAEQPPDHTLEGAFAFVLRVVTRLNALYPNEHAGLLEKLAGETIIPYRGTIVSASRICYPDQHLFKVLSDVPTTNGVEWEDNGFASIGGFIPRGYLAVDGVPPVVVPPPSTPPSPPSPPLFDLAALRQQIAEMAAELHEHVRADGDAHASINQNVTDGRSENRSFFAAVSAHWKSISAIAAPLVTYWTCHQTGKC